MKYKTLKIPETMFNEINNFLSDNQELGFISVTDFLKHAARKEMDYIKSIKRAERHQRLLEQRAAAEDREIFLKELERLYKEKKIDELTFLTLKKLIR